MENTPLFENEYFTVSTGESLRFYGPVGSDGAHLQFPCYQVINKDTGIVEKEAFQLAQAISDADFLAKAMVELLNQMEEADEEESVGIEVVSH